MVATAPHDALEQAQDAAQGGEGWRSGEGTSVEVDVLMKGGGSVHCAIGVVHRDRV